MCIEVKSKKLCAFMHFFNRYPTTTTPMNRLSSAASVRPVLCFLRSRM
jgi:hypothetical protein